LPIPDASNIPQWQPEGDDTNHVITPPTRRNPSRRCVKALVGPHYLGTSASGKSRFGDDFQATIPPLRASPRPIADSQCSANTTKYILTPSHIGKKSMNTSNMVRHRHVQGYGDAITCETHQSNPRKIDNFGPNPGNLRPSLPLANEGGDDPSGPNDGQPTLNIQNSTNMGIGGEQGLVSTTMGESQKRPKISSVEFPEIRKIDNFGPTLTSAGAVIANSRCSASTTGYTLPPSHIIGKTSMDTSSMVEERSTQGGSIALTCETHQSIPEQIDNSGPTLPLNSGVLPHTPTNTPQPTGLDLTLESPSNLHYELMQFEEIMECEDVPLHKWMDELQKRMPSTHRGALNELRNEHLPINIESYHDFKDQIIGVATRLEDRDTEYARVAITNSEIHFAIQQASLDGSSLCTCSTISSPSDDNTTRTIPSPRTPTRINIPAESMLINGGIPTSLFPIRHLDLPTMDTSTPSQYGYNRASLHILNNERQGRERNMPGGIHPSSIGQRGHRRV